MLSIDMPNRCVNRSRKSQPMQLEMIASMIITAIYTKMTPI